jgi:YHS domain-containing protein
MLRLIVLFLVGMAAFILVRGMIQTLLGAQQRKRKSDAASPQGADMVRDPVCESYIPKEGALSETVDGETYYFCSSVCARQFKKAGLSGKGG